MITHDSTNFHIDKTALDSTATLANRLDATTTIFKHIGKTRSRPNYRSRSKIGFSQGSTPSSGLDVHFTMSGYRLEYELAELQHMLIATCLLEHQLELHLPTGYLVTDDEIQLCTLYY